MRNYDNVYRASYKVGYILGQVVVFAVLSFIAVSIVALSVWGLSRLAQLL